LHAHYASKGAYLDCYATDIAHPATHADYVEAFYTTWLFKLERWILAWTVSKPSSDAQAHELAHAQRKAFAAWTEEARAENQLLMCDFLGRTRSWLMVSPQSGVTRLYFGSVVTARRDERTGRLELGRAYNGLLGFHKLYSRALLAAARSKLQRRHALLSIR
jgi:hypothetical protein